MRDALIETQNHLDGLSSSVDSLTDAVVKVHNRWRLLSVLVVLIIVTLALVVKFNYDGTVSRCETSNEIREEIDGKWQAITDFLIASNSGPDDPLTPPEAEFAALLSDDLTRVDCSDINWLGQ